MTPWHNERWATAPANDGKNFAPAHRWAIMGAMPLCYGLRDWNYHVEGMPCESCDDRVHLSCPHVNGILRNWASPEARTAALMRSYIREAHELRQRIKNAEHLCELWRMVAAGANQRIARLQGENAALRCEMLKMQTAKRGEA